MKIISLIADTLFPPRNSERTIRSLTQTTVRTMYHEETVSGITALSSYRDPLMQALITENKYFCSKHASQCLATLLQHWLQTKPGTITLLPIPLSAKRQKTRGYNQVTNILKALPANEFVTINTSLLIRARHTTPQTDLNREDRLKNLRGAFTCDTDALYAYTNTTIVVVDDVLTTGATMKEANAILTASLHPSSSVLCVAIAH